MVSSQLSELSLNSSTWMFKAGHSVVVSFIYEFVASFYHSSTQKTSQVGCLCGPWICPWFSPATLASTDASTRKPSQQSSLAYRLIFFFKKSFFCFASRLKQSLFCSTRESLYCIFYCHILILVLSPLSLLWTAWRQSLCFIYVLFPVIAGRLPCAE